MKYFGVILDAKGTFAPHLKAASAAVVDTAMAVGRFMPNIGGPSSAKRRLLVSVVNSKLLYVAPTWCSSALKFDVNHGVLIKAQRLIEIRVAQCYRTASVAAALRLVEIPPGDLIAREREDMRTIRIADPEHWVSTKEAAAAIARRRSIELRQERWETEIGMPAWTRRVLPSVQRWIKRPPEAPISFHLAQALTGHGDFVEYLH